MAFSELSDTDLAIDQVFLGGTAGNTRDDPLAVLLPVGNQGGFRYAGSPNQNTVKLVVLYSSGANHDWPDSLDEATGTYTYYGDNRQPGHDLHDTPRRGNQVLRSAYAAVADGSSHLRSTVPPFLLFERAGTTGRSVRFRGLLVPDSTLVARDEQLVAIWRSRDGQRFQNYRATFTVLDANPISRQWITDVLTGSPGSAAPRAWTEWSTGGRIRPLLAPRTLHHRSKAQQLPTTSGDASLLHALWAHFEHRPVDFEPCAVELFRLSAPAVQNADVTRPSRDGGRDAIGQYAIGPDADRVRLDFALEAKCYKPGNAVGVRELSRLISRIKHRQFGVLVTTSYVHEQAYQEVREDSHPIVILAGADLIAILKAAGVTTPSRLQRWLAAL